MCVLVLSENRHWEYELCERRVHREKVSVSKCFDVPFARYEDYSWFLICGISMKEYGRLIK
jgi:hypothetical protein